MTENYTLSDIAAVTDGNGRNNGMFGNDAWWIIILLLFGYGRNGFGGFGGGQGGYGMPCGVPATQADLAAGFNNSAVLSGINGIDSALCQGFNGINTAILQSTYNTQAGLNALQHSLDSCCCTTQRAIDSVKYENATNTCAIQNTIQNTTRDVIENANANSRAILDALNANYIRTLEQENNSLRLSASQSAQNAVLMAAMDANKAEILRRTGAECPTAAYIVQPPQPVTFPTNACGQFNGFGGNGCGCGSF
ncbi:MAG: hypothetical protein U0M06_02215 [Clostridia bacterium]|nr:hypothetical protein [Clostridia bacterium]